MYNLTAHLFKYFIHKPSKHLGKRDIESKKKNYQKNIFIPHKIKRYQFNNNLADSQQFVGGDLICKNLSL